MSEIIRKLRPVDFWHIGEFESWLSDMAKNGLYLKNVGAIFAEFTKAEPKQIRYRVDVSQNRRVTPEQKTMYSESGWEYVTSYGDFNIFSSLDEVGTPELHTDPAEQAYTLSYLDKKFAKCAIAITILIILIIVLLLFTCFIDSTPYLSLVEGGILQQAISGLAILYTGYASLQAAISIRALRKTLSEGKPINHSATWRRKQKVNLIISSAFVALAAFGVILPWMQIINRKTETLPTSSSNLPIVRLADIEQDSNLTRKPAYIQRGVDLSNRYSCRWSLFSPLQFETNEHGVIADKMWKDGSGEYSPSIDTWVYKLKIPSIKNGVLSDLMNRYSMKYEGGDFIEKENKDFDRLIIHESDYCKEIFAAKGKGVVYIRYYGYADFDSIIKVAAEKINLISD